MWSASIEGHEAVVGLLLERGAAIDQPENIIGATPLFEASQEGHEAVVETLLRAGGVGVDTATNTPVVATRRDPAEGGVIGAQLRYLGIHGLG